MSVAREAFALRRSAVLPLLAAGLAACLVAGCASTAEPGPLPSPSSSPSVSTSTATPPTLPPEAEGTSAKAAKAFARHYFDVINYAARTGDTDELRALGTKDCVSCEAIASNIEKIYNAGGHIESEGWSLRQIRGLQTTRTSSVLSLAVFLEPEAVVAESGSRETHKGRRQPMTMRLTTEADAYRVARLDLVT